MIISIADIREENTMEKFVCPCCGRKALDEKPPGTFDICPVCFWEDDDVQFDDPDYVGGANAVSLNVARENYKKFGAITQEDARRRLD